MSREFPFHFVVQVPKQGWNYKYSPGIPILEIFSAGTKVGSTPGLFHSHHDFRKMENDKNKKNLNPTSNHLSHRCVAAAAAAGVRHANRAAENSGEQGIGGNSVAELSGKVG